MGRLMVCGVPMHPRLDSSQSGGEPESKKGFLALSGLGIWVDGICLMLL